MTLERQLHIESCIPTDILRVTSISKPVYFTNFIDTHIYMYIIIIPLCNITPRYPYKNQECSNSARRWHEGHNTCDNWYERKQVEGRQLIGSWVGEKGLVSFLDQPQYMKSPSISKELLLNVLVLFQYPYLNLHFWWEQIQRLLS